ncbi:MAG: hypothetical protein WD894_18620 [Pirellulales bacterium]
MTPTTSIKATRPRVRAGLRGQRTLFCLLLLMSFLVVVYFVVPPLPAFFQRLVGLVNALLAMVAAMFAVREYGRSYNRLRVPGVGSVRTNMIVGGLVFLVVFAWWLSPWAPIAPLN